MITAHAPYTVLMLFGNPLPLCLEGKTLAQANQMIRWQVRGGEKAERFAITRYVPAEGVFRCIKTGTDYRIADRGSYTAKAFDAFLAELPQAA